MTAYADLPMSNGMLDTSKLDDIEFPIVFEFSKPLKNGQEQTEIREPTVGDIEVAQRKHGDLKQNMTLLTQLANNLAPEDVESMRPRDFTKLLGVVTPFLG